MDFCFIIYATSFLDFSCVLCYHIFDKKSRGEPVDRRKIQSAPGAEHVRNNHACGKLRRLQEVRPERSFRGIRRILPPFLGASPAGLSNARVRDFTARSTLRCSLRICRGSAAGRAFIKR